MSSQSRLQKQGPKSGSGSRLFDVGALVILITLGAVVPLLIAQSSGALRIPRSDDWSYLTTLFRWIDGNGLSFNRWVSMTLVGQLLIAAPVALIAHHSIAAVHIETALIGAIGLGSLYFLGIRVTKHRSAALLVAVTMTLSPIWIGLAATYMTDIPTFTLQTLMLSAAAKGILGTKKRTQWLLASAGLGVAGCSIRQFAIVPLVATLIVFALIAKREKNPVLMRATMTVGLLSVISVTAIIIFWSHIPDPLQGAPIHPSAGSIREASARGLGYLRLCGLLLIPVIAYAGPVRITKRAWEASKAITIALSVALTIGLAGSAATLGEDAFVGNYMHPRGILGDDVLETGTRPYLISKPAWLMIVAIGSVGAILICLVAVPALKELSNRYRNRRDSNSKNVLDIDPISALFGITLAGLFAAYISTDALQINRFPIFDRYVIAGLPLVALLILRSTSFGESTQPRRSPVRVSGLIVSILFLSSLGMIWGIDSARYDATRWLVAQDAVAKGFNPLHIDGGFEWVSWHRQKGGLFADTESERKINRSKYLAPLCVSLANDPQLRDTQIEDLIAMRTYRSPLGANRKIIALRNKRKCGGTAR